MFCRLSSSRSEDSRVVSVTSGFLFFNESVVRRLKFNLFGGQTAGPSCFPFFHRC